MQTEQNHYCISVCWGGHNPSDSEMCIKHNAAAVATTESSICWHADKQLLVNRNINLAEVVFGFVQNLVLHPTLRNYAKMFHLQDHLSPLEAADTRSCAKLQEAENIPVLACPTFSPDMSPIECL